MNKSTREKFEVPAWEKYALTINEASCYFHIGDKRLRELISEDPHAEYLLKNKDRVLIKRKLFEHFLDQQEAI